MMVKGRSGTGKSANVRAFEMDKGKTANVRRFEERGVSERSEL